MNIEEKEGRKPRPAETPAGEGRDSTARGAPPPSAAEKRVLPPHARRSPHFPLLYKGASFDPEVRTLCRRARENGTGELKRLAVTAEEALNEIQQLRRQLQRREFDFSTLFEIIGQTSARSLDLEAMQTYILRTISGRFATPLVLLMRRSDNHATCLTYSSSQGLRNTGIDLEIPLSSALCKEALERRFCISLEELPAGIEVEALRKLGVRLAVPLVQEVESNEAVLEGFVFLGRGLSGRPYTTENLEFLQILGKMTAICLHNESLYRRAIVDDLTGVASRGHFDVRLTQEINRIRVYGHRSLGLVMLDVDRFKEFNDRYGHQTGDRVLRELGLTLQRQIRNVDLAARYGGEEFVVVLLEIDAERVLEVAERLRAAVEALRITPANGKGELRVTASFGASCFPEDATDKTELIHLADQALYKAKALGRNRVVAARSAADNRDATRPPFDRRAADRRKPAGEVER